MNHAKDLPCTYDGCGFVGTDYKALEDHLVDLHSDTSKFGRGSGLVFAIVHRTNRLGSIEKWAGSTRLLEFSRVIVYFGTSNRMEYVP